MASDPRTSVSIRGYWNKRFSSSRIAFWTVTILIVFSSLFPLWWVLRTALTGPRAVYTNTTSMLPVDPTLGNFARALGLVDTQTALAAGGSGQTLNFLLFLRNSIIVASLVAFGQVFFSALAAYAFARLRFPFRDQLFFLYITGLMVPGVVLLIPNFVFVRNMNWVGTFQGIVAPVFLMTPFAVFFMRQFFLTQSKEIEEAAILDGASRFGIFRRIALPLSAPALITLIVLTFIGSWNDYLWPLVVGRSEEVRVLTVALGIFRSQTPQGAPDWTGLMAAAALAMIPTLTIFTLLGRRVVDSIQFSGFR